MEKYNNWKLKFYTIQAGQAVSLITSAILQMAIIFYLTEKTGSAMVLSMASLVGFLPYAVFGPAIGVLVDRHDRKKIMIGADLIIAAAGAVLAIVAFYMELPVWMVMIVLFIRSIGTCLLYTSWKDSKSQVGAYRILSNAKAAADKNPGTFVFANDGTAIYPADSTAEPDYRVHTVVKGDTLWDIAVKYLGKGSRYTEIKKLNGLSSNVIYSGWKLKIPN